MEHRSNPVLDADWPDPDAIRVGEEFWMIASSFNRAPGLPVLRSRDLVEWEHVTNALPAVPPLEHYALPRRGSGVWAPSLREHDGTFYIVYPDPDHGILVLSAPHPAGPWSPPWTLLPGRGLIDPCPVWDEDGRAHLVHGWARSRAGVKNRLSLLEVTEDLTAPLSPSMVIIDGAEIPDMLTLEGPKVYRHGGHYWIWAPAGGVADGYQVVFRAESLRGPWEHRIVLEQGSTAVNGPHQGALVDDPHGDWWFLHFQDRGVFGRVTHAQPVRFDDEGWPHLGAPLDGVRGEPVARVPELGDRAGSVAAPVSDAPYTEPQRSDDFTAAALHPRWHWQANPQAAWFRTGHGTLDLALAPSPRGDLRDLGAILGQQLPGQPSTWSTELHLPGVPAGAPPVGTERAGLVVLGLSYAWAGLLRDEEGVALVQGTMAEDAADETVRTVRRLTGDPGADVRVRLHLEVDEHGRITLGASVPRSGSDPAPGAGAEEADPEVLLASWQATKGRWIGAEVGLFATVGSMVHHDLDDRRARFGPVRVRREGREI
ncbi:glycoside hydrolase 43 family protein [Brachybacterium sp. YJGR34]|uniref:glycoside hydrolase family 43 protein n=1 Tax=Brachybacterium sp. YJGR34 TaxID=2059911 RepID=UPI000E0C20AA|nr:glycoside hydrolase 43 family protein [Brachybacterium sp. YJGR34]